MKDNGMNYSLSVFLPESKFDKEVISRNEIIEILQIRNSELGDIKNSSILESIIDKVFAKEMFNPTKFNM